MKTIWKRRSEEWVKANPKQGTMYKVCIDENGNELGEVTKDKPKPEPAKEPEFIDGVPSVLYKPNKHGYVDSKKIDKYKNSDPKKRGVYVIICEAEKHAYVGQSFNVPVRLRNHKMCIINKSEQHTYRKMIQHYKKHKIESFQFIDYEYIEHATEEQLLKREGELMAEFAKMGYKLYNGALSKQVIDSSIFCPDNIRADIELIIRHIIDNPASAQKLNEFAIGLK